MREEGGGKEEGKKEEERSEGKKEGETEIQLQLLMLRLSQVVVCWSGELRVEGEVMSWRGCQGGKAHMLH